MIIGTKGPLIPIANDDRDDVVNCKLKSGIQNLISYSAIRNPQFNISFTPFVTARLV